MKTKIIPALAVAAVFICFALTPPIGADDTSTGGGATGSSGIAVAAFPEIKHEFDPVLEGSEVVHDFMVKNNGQATLDIKNVRTG